MNTSLISIVVPIYNVEEYLVDCILSIVAQTYHNIEIILVDDGSPDSCSLVCDEWALNDNRISVIHKKNGGLSDARNAGIEASIGEYIGFVDSDDYIEHNMFELMISAMNENVADYCACGVQTEYESNGESVFHLRDFFVGNSEQTLEKLYNENEFPVSSWCKLSKVHLWDNLRFPVGKNYEDAFTTYLLIDRAETIVQIPDICYHYRIRENSIMTDKSFSEKNLDECSAWKENYQFVKKHYPRIAPVARYFWLEHVKNTIIRISNNNTPQLLRAKRELSMQLINNSACVFFELGPKKAYSLLKK